MASVPTVRVKFKEGKFKGDVMRINADEFNEALHEAAKPKAAKPKAAKPK